MTVNRILYLVLLILTNFYVAANDSTNISSIKCQSSKPLRKQIPVEPLNGICLRDAVVQLSQVLQCVVNEELGVSSFQKMINKMEFANIFSSIDTRLNLLVDKFNNKLRSYINILEHGYNAVHLILSKMQEQSVYSNQIGNLNIAQNTVSDICTQIITVLATNLRHQEWKNLHILPINQLDTMCGPPILTHTIGPLLLSQYCSKKNVIILLDHSMSMSESDFSLAQITAKAIIDMLSEMDNVTVIGLSNSTPLFCKDGLLKATDINKFQLTRYIDGLVRIDSNRTTTVDFRTLTQNLENEIIIIHLTNEIEDISNVQEIFDIVSKNLKAYLKTILILTDHQLHIKAKYSLNNDSFLIVPTQNVLDYEIGKLFSCLQCPTQKKKEYHVLDPYFELYSKTMTLSIGQITDVALLSLNIKLRDFLDDVTYFNAGSNVYAIFFDSKGIVWMHKNFPRIETIMEQPLKVHLQDIENLDSQIVMKMINEVQGIIDVKTKLDEQKRYRWKHLIYEDLIICLVSTTEEGVLPVARTVPSLPMDVLHHRLDLMLQTVVDKDALCIYRNRIITLSMGAVYLSPWCFQSPIEQLKLLETGSTVNVQSYMAYIKDMTGLLANPGLHSSVKLDVAILAQVLRHFKKQHIESLLNKFVIRRYIVGTVSGVLEIFPGMVLDSGFDPKRRMWYGKALEHPDKIILTPPYLDAAGSGYVVTLSHVIKYPKNGSTDYVIAVLSMDVTMGYIMKLLLDMFSFCNDATVKCFLMDDKGYLIVHPTLLEATGKIEQQHLTHKELLVANDILNHEMFVKKKLCANYLDGTAQRYYQFNTSLDEVLTNIAHGEHCVKYQVTAVAGTNVFLGVVNVTTQCNLLRAFCPCSTMDHSCLNCKSMEQNSCECPCECSLYTSSCTEQNIDNLSSCPPLYEQGSSLQTPWIQPANLKFCPSVECKSYKTERDCLGVADCQWCHIDADGETFLQQPFCSDTSMCFKGIFGFVIPYNDGTYNSHSTNEIVIQEWPSVGPVAGGILALVLLLGITLFCYRLRSMQSGVEHQCLHRHTSPDTLRMTHIEGDLEPMELDQTKNNLDCLVRDNVATISPYRISTNYRRPPGGDSDHGYSTMTPHDDSEQQTFASEPLLVGNNVEPDLNKQSNVGVSSPTTYLESPHHVLVPVTVHRDMETTYC